MKSGVGRKRGKEFKTSEKRIKDEREGKEDGEKGTGERGGGRAAKPCKRWCRKWEPYDLLAWGGRRKNKWHGANGGNPILGSTVERNARLGKQELERSYFRYPSYLLPRPELRRRWQEKHT